MINARPGNKCQRTSGHAKLGIASRTRRSSMKIIDRTVPSDRAAEPRPRSGLVTILGLHPAVRLDMATDVQASVDPACRLLVVPVVEGHQVSCVVAELV